MATYWTLQVLVSAAFNLAKTLLHQKQLDVTTVKHTSNTTTAPLIF